MPLTGFDFRGSQPSNIPGVMNTGRPLPMVQLPGLDSIEQTCWHEFLDCSMRLFAALDGPFSAAHGLTLTEVRLLNLLAVSSNGAVRKTELRRALMVSPDRVAQIFRRLETRGLVAQCATRYDRRGVMLSITDAGRARLEGARKTLSQEVRTHFLDRMSHQQMVALIDGHRRIGTPPQASTSGEVSEAKVTASD
jgi:DNA-binding MarR family transcriptional regulator